MEIYKKYPILFKLFLAGIFGIFGWFAPFWPLKFIFGIIAAIIFALILPKGRIGFIILSFIIFIPSFSITSFLNSKLIFSFPFFKSYNYSSTSDSKTIEPNLSMETAQHVEIHLNGGVIIYLESGNTIRYSDQLKVEFSETSLRLSGGERNKSYIVYIGTDNLKSLDVNSVGIVIYGSNVNILDNFNINGTGIKINGVITSKKFNIDGTGISLDGNYFGKYMNLDGTGISINGKYDIETINIDGTGIKLNMSIGSSYNVEISGTAVSGVIEYSPLDSSLKRNLNVHGTSGNITIKNSNGINIKVRGPKVILR